MAGSRQVELEPDTIEFVRTRHCKDANFEIGRTARQRADDRKVRLNEMAWQRMPAGWNQAPCRLMAEDPTEMRRIADRATNVGTEFETTETSG